MGAEANGIQRREPPLGRLKMRHYFGREQFHAAHDSAVRNSATDIEPANHAADLKLLAQALEAVNAGLGRIENRHHLTRLLVTDAAQALEAFA